MRSQSVVALLVLVGFVRAADAQPPPPPPTPTPTPAPAPAPTPAPAPAPKPVPKAAAPKTCPTVTCSCTPSPCAAPATAPASADDPAGPADPALSSPDKAGLRLHFLTTRRTYAPVEFDVFSVESRQVVLSGAGAIESRGDVSPLVELAPGLYKVVRAGEPFNVRADFATVTLTRGVVTDYVIVVEPDTYEFRGSGPVTDELPKGREIAGIRLALNAGGTLIFNQKTNPIGTTDGTTILLGLFGNFGLTYEKDAHFLDVGAEAQVDIVDTPTGSVAASRDRFEASALYTFKFNNPYFGPYVRGGFRTRLFPGYLYLQADQAMGTVTINRLDGSTDTQTFGGEANPDDLRIKLAKPFAPFILQEEIGANLKAADLDLLLLKLIVATRLGWGFRQGVTNGLLVVDGTDKGNAITLNEVDDYSTLGPVIGANAKVTFARWLFGAASFGMMIPIVNREDAGSGFGERLLIDFSGTGGFKVPILTDLLFASFDYSFRLERDGFLTDETQFEHTLMARANVTLF